MVNSEHVVISPAAFGSGNFTMRPYQEDAVRSVFDQWNTGSESTLVVMATGLGKTVVMAEGIRQFPVAERGKVMAIAHRRELIDQFVDKTGRHTGVSPDIEMGQDRVSAKLYDQSEVVASSVQTQNSSTKCMECGSIGCEKCIDGRRYRMQKFDPFKYGLLLVDEGHHAPAATYRRMIDWYRRNPNLRVLMVTATPKRHDKLGMHNVVDSVAIDISINEGIEEGWLVPIRQKYITVDGLDFSWCDTKYSAGGKDLSDGDVAAAMMGRGDDMERERLLHEVVSPTVQEVGERQCLMFAANKDHAASLTDVLNRHEGVVACCVVDHTSPEDRKEYIRAFREQRCQFLVGCGVFLEGFDAPSCSVIAVARPTESVALYTQMIGRGTRPEDGLVDGDGMESATSRRNAIGASGKPYCTILDFVGNSGKHKMVSTADVLAGKEIDPVDVMAAVENATESGETVDIWDEIARAKENRIRLEQMEDERRERVRQDRLLREAERQDEERQRLLGVAEYTCEDVNLFVGGNGPIPHRQAGTSGSSTMKQVQFLQKLGVTEAVALSFSKRQAGAVIDEITSRRGPDHVMPFGKHAGKAVKDIDRGYLGYILGWDQLRTELRQSIRYVLEHHE